MADAPEEDLLQSLLGPVAAELPDSIRLAHRAPLHAVGQMDIQGSSSLIGSFWGWFWQLPKPGSAVDTEVWVSSENGGQRWVRRFGDQWLETHQCLKRGLLIESKGLSSIGMRVWVEDGNLKYRTVSAWLRLIPIPLWIVPLVEAEVSDAPFGWQVSVVVKMRGLGVICRYSGNMREL